MKSILGAVRAPLMIKHVDTAAGLATNTNVDALLCEAEGMQYLRSTHATRSTVACHTDLMWHIMCRTVLVVPFVTMSAPPTPVCTLLNVMEKFPR